MNATSGLVFVSVIVPASNEERLLPRTLERITEAFDAAKGTCEWELIVCDNNSTDHTAALATGAGARVVFEPVSQISRARNRGASAARGNWLLFIDADSYPSPDLIADVLDLIRGGRHVGCGSTLKVEGGPRWFRLAWVSKNPSMRLLRWCSGAFLLCEASAFRELGGFSTELYAFEEADFVRRLKRYGRPRGKVFAILYRHPFVTSGRKGDLGFLSWLRTVGVLWLSPKRSLRDLKRLDKWYHRR